ncbi:MAG: tetratricopeptide repeat protein [Acidobacteria bacterium]|nr:tetratricopeptide repeat protein [Acidobacteriota bacterium]
MKSIAISFTLFASVLQGLVWGEPLAHIDEQSALQAGEQLIERRRFTDAIQLLIQVLPEIVDREHQALVVHLLGRAEFESGRFRLAKQYFEKAARLWPQPEQQAADLANLGRTYLELGEYSHAEATLRQALREPLPRAAVAWHDLGQVLALQGRRKEAHEAFGRAAEQADISLKVSIWSDLAAIHVAEGDRRRAHELMLRALALAPPGQKHARIAANIGVLLAEMKDREGGLRWLRQALSEMESAMGPEHPDVAQILEDSEQVLHRTGRRTEAAQYRQRLAAIRAAHPDERRATEQSVDWRALR